MAQIVEQQTGIEELTERTNRQAKRGGTFGLIFLCLILSAIATIPFYFFGRPQFGPKQWNLQMPITHDMHLHFEQMKSFYNGLAAGSIYPRWEEDTNRGFGAPTTTYYPPGVYYITSAFYALSRDWLVTLLATHLLMMMAAAIGFLFYIRQFVSDKAAVIATFAYIFLPYHLLDQYQRGAMAELLGFVWMPLMLMFGERLFRRKDDEEAGDGARSSVLLNLAGLAGSYGAFLWSHPPTAYQFSLVFGVYALILAVLRRDLRGLIFVGFAIALGVLLSAAYLYPAAAEQDFIRHEYVTETWPYHSTYIFVHHMPYSTPGTGGFFRLLDSIWIFGTLVILASAGFIFAFSRRRLSTPLKERLLLWLVAGCFASFMMLKYSAPLGRHIPKIDIGVFTWRMLSITTLVAALFAGLCAHLAFDKFYQSKSRRVIFGSVAGVISLGGIVFSIVAVAATMFYAPNFIPATEHLNYAMIPHDALEEPTEMPRLERAMLMKGKGEVSVEKWLPEKRSLRAVLQEDDTLFVRTYNFPGWTATVNGQPATLKTGDYLKEINLDLAAGEYQIELQYLDTPVRQRGERVTKIAFAIFLVTLIMGVVGRAVSRKRFSSPPSMN